MPVDQENPQDNVQAELAQAGAKAMQLLGVDYPEAAAPAALDITINAIDAPHYAPARAQPYNGPAKSGPIINESLSQEARAIAYANTVFPDSKFTFLGDGRYGVVLADETGKAFKVYRDARRYSRYEKEAGALQLLSQHGFAPKLHMFVDAGEEYRLDAQAHDYTEFGFEDVQIPRQNSGKELPIMVMDKVDVAPLATASPDKFIDGFCKMAEVFIKENIHPHDAEIMVHRATGELIMLDVGELYQESGDFLDLIDPVAAGEPSGPREKLEVLRSLALHTGLGHEARKIQAAYTQGGLDAVRDFLAQTR